MTWPLPRMMRGSAAAASGGAFAFAEFVVDVRDFSPSAGAGAGTTAGGVDCVDAASAGTAAPRVTSVATGVADDSACA